MEAGAEVPGAARRWVHAAPRPVARVLQQSRNASGQEKPDKGGK